MASRRCRRAHPLPCFQHPTVAQWWPIVTFTISHSSLGSFEHSKRIKEPGQGPASVLPSEDEGDPLLLAHLGLEQPCSPAGSVLSTPPCQMCPAPTQAIISAQAWVQVQETWSVSHPSAFECVVWPGSLFTKVLLISADLPMIVGRLLFLLLLGQGLASARKTGSTWNGHVCICV